MRKFNAVFLKKLSWYVHNVQHDLYKITIWCLNRQGVVEFGQQIQKSDSRHRHQEGGKLP